MFSSVVVLDLFLRFQIETSAIDFLRDATDIAAIYTDIDVF